MSGSAKRGERCELPSGGTCLLYTSPVLLGIVLGPLAEKNFRRAMVISEGSFSIFFTRPISCAFILIAIVSVAIFGIRNYKSRKLAKQNTAETSGTK